MAIKNNLLMSKRGILHLLLGLGVLAGCIFNETSPQNEVISAPASLEFRWDQDNGPYKKLYYTQSSSEKRDRSTYYLVMKSRHRKTGILKLSITFPDHFDSVLTEKKFKLCKIQIGGMLEKTKCKEYIPADFEVNENQTAVEVFPDEPIPVSKDSYAIVMKIFNPTRSGMFQINATSQSPGDLPISLYLGSWNIDIK
tara:strand:+ start:326 stop:916 length:591 start_codon:yes stop_codon:yes gene_type:complete